MHYEFNLVSYFGIIGKNRAKVLINDEISLFRVGALIETKFELDGLTGKWICVCGSLAARSPSLAPSGDPWRE